jgi:SAM-dependent methyltransferase
MQSRDRPSHVRRVVDELGVTADHSVLDLGCGEGEYLEAVASNHPRRIVALDLSLDTLRLLHMRTDSTADAGCGDVSLVCGDALRLPFADCSFDRVICALVLYLLPIEASLRELFRVMDTSAKAYVRVPMLSWARARGIFSGPPDPRQWVYAACHVVNGLLFALTGRQTKIPFLRHDRWALHVPSNRLRSAIETVGFSLEHVHVVRSISGTPSVEAWLAKP